MFGGKLENIVRHFKHGHEDGSLEKVPANAAVEQIRPKAELAAVHQCAAPGAEHHRGCALSKGGAGRVRLMLRCSAGSY